MGWCELSAEETNAVTSEIIILRGGFSYVKKVDVTTLPRVLSLSGTFFEATSRGVSDFLTPGDTFKQRIGAPLATCFSSCSSLKNHFFRPYQSGASFIDGFVCGFFIPGMTVRIPVAAIGASISALGELIIGIGSMFQSLYHLANGNIQLAKDYALDGVSRIMLSPALLIVSLLAMPVEVIRFFTRSITTLFEMVRECCAPSPAKEVPIYSAESRTVISVRL